MKKLAALLISAILVVCLCSCNNQQAVSAPDTAGPGATVAVPETEQSTEAATGISSGPSKVFKFPEGTVLCGVDVSGMLRPDAYAAVCEALDAYSLTLTVNGKTFTLTAEDMSLTCPETEIIAYVAAVEKGEDPGNIKLISYDSAAVRHKLAMSLNTSAKNASIHYNSSADKFQLTEASSGKTVDLNPVMDALDPVILSLGTELSVNAAETEVEPSITADSDTAKNALAKANNYLNISLTYTYTPDNGQTKSEKISKDTIGSFITFGNDLTTYISSSELRNYVNRMSSKYSVKGDAGQFKTSGGYYINLTVDYAGQPVDTDGLFDDIKYCLNNGISGTRAAPYLDVIECEELAFDGNYVEVNLSAQWLWVYRNGNCVVSTPIVSGCAYYHWTTPTGVYSIYGKYNGATLTGPGYSSWVNYWMPFSGGYGLHDANWRSSFGGDIYLYDGSHGCVNIPPSAAATVFSNVSVGTKVILYGGATSADPVEQRMKGTAEYNVASNAAPFKLDAQPEYGENKEVTYVSSNPKVAEVAADGTVTIKGVGTTTITVTAPEREYYTSAEMDVTITVYDHCEKNGHTFGQWKETKKATCTEAGEQTRTCSVCETVETQVIAATGHTFGSWSVVTAATCTTDGEQVRTCSACAITESQVLPAGHTYGDWSETLVPTCTTDGERIRSCAVCGSTETETIPATGHSYGEWTEITAAGCTTDGQMTHTCGTCQNTESQAIPATGHIVDTWTTTSEPSCTTDGTEEGVCGTCGQTVTQSIPATGSHTYENGSCTACGQPDPALPPEEPSDPAETTG